MKPVMQTVTGPRGNCMAACLASIFELPIEAVPNFFDVAGDGAGPWWQAIRDWLKPRGFACITLTFEDAAMWDSLCLDGYHIVCGKSPRIDGAHHATVWSRGAMVHDPHPEQTGIAQPETLDLLYPLDAARLALTPTDSCGSPTCDRPLGALFCERCRLNIAVVRSARQHP